MTEPTQRQVDSELEDSMDLFQRADVGTVSALSPIVPERLLMVFDGSQQDSAVMSLGDQIREQTNCRVDYMFLPPSDDTQPATEIGERLRALAAEEVSSPGDENYERILATAQDTSADLLIIPCPFGRDFESVGDNSAGTVIDVLTARLPIPFIAVRRPVIANDIPTKHVRLVFTGSNAAAEKAARQAIGLSRPGGRLDMLLLVEESFYKNFREAMHAIDPDKRVTYEELEHALARTYGKLHASLQHTASEHKLSYELLIRNEHDEQPISPGDPKTHPALVVLGLKRSEHDSQGEIHDYVRRSPHPVLVVSVD